MTGARASRILVAPPRWVILIITVISLLASDPAERVGFDYNLLHMQTAAGRRGVPGQLIHLHSLRAVGRSWDQPGPATNLIATLTNLPTVSTVDSMAPYLVQDAGPSWTLA